MNPDWAASLLMERERRALAASLAGEGLGSLGAFSKAGASCVGAALGLFAWDAAAENGPRATPTMGSRGCVRLSWLSLAWAAANAALTCMRASWGEGDARSRFAADSAEPGRVNRFTRSSSPPAGGSGEPSMSADWRRR